MAQARKPLKLIGLDQPAREFVYSEHSEAPKLPSVRVQLTKKKKPHIMQNHVTILLAHCDQVISHNQSLRLAILQVTSCA